jgi:porin
VGEPGPSVPAARKLDENRERSDQNERSIRAFDTVESRKGYSGLYQFGASYNPGKFPTPFSTRTQSGNYLLYWMASQALWRVDPKGAKGLDGTFQYDWSPPDINRNNTMLTAGLRFNEPLPLPIHNTMSLVYLQNRLSQHFDPPGQPRKHSRDTVHYPLRAKVDDLLRVVT